MTDNKKPVLVLDLDGTLVDSGVDLVAALNFAIGEVGLSPIPVEQIVEAAGKGAKIMISKAHEIHGHTLSDDRMDKVFECFLEYYQLHIAVFSKPYPGLNDAMNTFSENGWLLAVCTNKHEKLARKLLNELGSGALVFGNLRLRYVRFS